MREYRKEYTKTHAETPKVYRERIRSQVNLPANNYLKMEYKIAALNLCLGLPNKKNLVKNLINESKIGIPYLQKTEVKMNFDHNLLTLTGFNFEAENNNHLVKVGMYLRIDIKYIRRI